MVTEPTTVEILRGMKAAIERNGWAQHGYIDKGQHEAGTPIANCRVDLYGALRIAATGDVTNGDDLTADEARMILLRLVVAESDTGPMGLASWNDWPGRTVDEVYALLDHAIERAEAGA